MECLLSEHWWAHRRESAHVHDQCARVVIKLSSLRGHAIGTVVHVDVTIRHLNVVIIDRLASLVNATHLRVVIEGRRLHATWVQAWVQWTAVELHTR